MTVPDVPEVLNTKALVKMFGSSYLIKPGNHCLVRLSGCAGLSSPLRFTCTCALTHLRRMESSTTYLWTDLFPVHETVCLTSFIIAFS